MLKKNYSILGFILLFSIIACEKIKELTTFTIENETEISIPGQSGLNIPLIIRSPEVATSSEQSFSNNNTRANLVEEATLDQLKLVILSPDEQTFDFLNEIKLYIKDESGNEALLASSSNIPEDGSKTLALETTGADLKPFIKQESYTIRTEAKTDQVINQDVQLRVEMAFRIRAKIF